MFDNASKWLTCSNTFAKQIFKPLKFETMKKLKLGLANLEGAEVLTRQQLKMVMGGSGDGGGDSCSTMCKCPNGYIVRDGVVLPEVVVYPCTVCEISDGNWIKCSGTQYNCSLSEGDCTRF